MLHPVDVKALSGYRIWLRYEDGVEGEVDLSHLVGRGVFNAWRTRPFFESVRIGEDGGIVWSEEIELCPDALYLRVTGKDPEDVFPRLKAVRTDA